ncbi:MAG TPA: hypothetical protein VIR01_05290, partial [Pyrinomonadaceae bacterium]
RYAFESLVNREIRKWRRDERRLGEHRTTKHQVQARNSCVADWRNYRVARRFPMSAAAQLEWK